MPTQVARNVTLKKRNRKIPGCSMIEGEEGEDGQQNTEEKERVDDTRSLDPLLSGLTVGPTTREKKKKDRKEYNIEL